MKSYFVFRYLTPVALMIGWVAWQLLVKKKKWEAVEGAAYTSVVFVTVWMGIAYFLLD